MMRGIISRIDATHQHCRRLGPDLIGRLADGGKRRIDELCPRWVVKDDDANIAADAQVPSLKFA